MHLASIQHAGILALKRFVLLLLEEGVSESLDGLGKTPRDMGDVGLYRRDCCGGKAQ